MPLTPRLPPRPPPRLPLLIKTKSVKRFEKVVITGASSGFGEGFALAYAAPGVTIGLMARRGDRLAEVAEKIEARGGAAVVLQADVRIEAEVHAAATRWLDAHGAPDLVIANAGVGEWKTGFDADEQAFVFGVNLMGTVYTVGQLLPSMLAAGKGSVVAISSLASYRAMPLSVAYSASKAGVATYMQGLRVRYREKGVSFLSIHPGFVRTPLTERNPTPMPFLMELDEAIARMTNAIAKGRTSYAFPLPTAMLMRIMSWLPDAAIYKLAGPKKKKKKAS